jgi:hypothetical protein
MGLRQWSKRRSGLGTVLLSPVIESRARRLSSTAVYPSRRRFTLLGKSKLFCGGATDTLLKVRQRMRALALSIPQRFAVSSASALVAASLYVMASAQAYSPHPYPSLRALFHPWESWSLTLGIVSLCFVCWKSAFPMFRAGSVLQRVAVVLVLALPACMLVHFVLVLAHVAVWSFQELTAA